jgi:hypothetical protein
VAFQAAPHVAAARIEAAKHTDTGGSHTDAEMESI